MKRFFTSNFHFDDKSQMTKESYLNQITEVRTDLPTITFENNV